MRARRPSETLFEFSRRGFLAALAATAGSGRLRRTEAKPPPEKLRIRAGTPRSRVVQVESAQVVDGPQVHRLLLSEMLDKALTSLTGAATLSDAWRVVLRPSDVIGLKFCRSGQRALATTETLAAVLIESLVAAGFQPEQIVCVEAPAGVEARAGTTPARRGYLAVSTDFGSGTDRYAAVLDQITALVSVPFLKTHNIAGMTCALKNLSHGLIKHPARYHGNGCSPFIGDIVAAPPIGRKLRLCLVDALRVVHDGGPEAHAEGLSSAGILLAAFDPVATDRVGLSILNAIRRGRDLDPVARSAEELGYLAAAHRRGLGVALWDGIDRLRYRL